MTVHPALVEQFTTQVEDMRGQIDAALSAAVTLAERAMLRRLDRNLQHALCNLDAAQWCPVCGEREPIACPHCGVEACPDCQADAHGEEDRRPWRCKKAPAKAAPQHDGPEDPDIAF